MSREVEILIAEGRRAAHDAIDAQFDQMLLKARASASAGRSKRLVSMKVAAAELGLNESTVQRSVVRHNCGWKDDRGLWVVDVEKLRRKRAAAHAERAGQNARRAG